jgi:hypothetical protein
MNLETIIFKDPATRPDIPPEAFTDEETQDIAAEGERFILCRQCGHMITAPDESTWMSGSHRHTFANPVGVVYEIGCFNAAPGCRSVGPATDEFTWFSGYLWRVAICGKCLTHLGWHFISMGGHGFYGLILDRLMQPEQQDTPSDT